jgi:hypothetical protein
MDKNFDPFFLNDNYGVRTYMLLRYSKENLVQLSLLEQSPELRHRIKILFHPELNERQDLLTKMMIAISLSQTRDLSRNRYTLSTLDSPLKVNERLEQWEGSKFSGISKSFLPEIDEIFSLLNRSGFKFVLSFLDRDDNYWQRTNGSETKLIKPFVPKIERTNPNYH